MEERRSKINSKLECRIHTRITKEKYEELTQLLAQCRSIHSHSELLRHILDNSKITIQTRDISLDKVILELASIRKELQSIGININQVTHRFHIEDLPDGKLFQALEIAKLYHQCDLKVSQLFEIVGKLSEQWSQG